MLITRPDALKVYGAPYRLWQGVSGIEVTGKKRIFRAFYSGCTREEIAPFYSGKKQNTARSPEKLR